MANLHAAQHAQSIKKLTCFIAKTPEIIKEVQCLRFCVFGEELGATLKSGAAFIGDDEFYRI